MIYVHLAEGFEEVEALTAVDVLRRAEIEVNTVSVTGKKTVTGTHGIPVEADILYEDADYTKCEMIVLPGGMPGASNLQAHEGLLAHVKCFAENNKKLAAICAAPMIFGACGILEGKNATIYPGMENCLSGANATGEAVEVAGNIITGKGPALAMEFALALVESLKGRDVADAVAKDLFYMSENKMDYLKATNIHETDLHIHTHYSDGQSDPASIVKKAKELGYAVIAITDHDGTGGLREAVEAGIREKIKVVPGIELAVETEKGIGLHILGYDIDMENPGLRKVLLDLESRRQRRNEKLLSVLAEKGYLLSQDELKRIQPEGFIGKPVIARALAQKGYVKDYREAFEEGKFLECKEAKAVKKEKIRADEAISLIHAAGGTAVLAHPIQTKKIGKPASEEFYRNIEAIIVKLKTEGLKGLECYHPDQNYEQTRRFIELAEKHNLYITRGSDFHGSDYGDAKPTA